MYETIEQSSVKENIFHFSVTFLVIASLSGDQLFSRCFYLTKSLILSNPREETPTQSFPLKGRIFATEMIDLHLITKADLASSCKLLKSKQQAPCGFFYQFSRKH